MALIRDASVTPLTVHPIRLLPDPVLRRKAVRVPGIDASIHRLIEDMIESMYAANGVGLAAPQIGVSLRVVVIGMPEEEPFALINPEVVKRTGERTVDEGCLSLPGYRGELTRSTLVIVKALDPSGKQVRIRAKDNLLAQALEHETDHLNGTLYVDHLPSMAVLRKIEPPGASGDEAAAAAASGHD